MKDATSCTGTATLSEFILCFSGVRVSQFLVFRDIFGHCLPSGLRLVGYPFGIIIFLAIVFPLGYGF